MLSIAIFLAAGQAPVQLASLDEQRWQHFVRTSIAAPPRPVRMDQLADTVGRLKSDPLRRRTVLGMRGPTGM